MLRKTVMLGAVWFAAAMLAAPALAQFQTPVRTTTGGTTAGGATVGGNVNAGTGTSVGTTQGLSQTGTIQSQAAIQRNQADFVGRNGGEHPRSMVSQQATSPNSQFNVNTTSAIGGLTGGLGGLGGIGGGLGGFGTTGIGGGLGGRGLNTALGYGATGFGNTAFGAQGVNQQRGTQQFGNQQGQQQIRTRIALGFESTPVAATVVSERFANRLTRLPGLGDVTGVTIQMDGNVAVLTGSVATGRDRNLVAQLAILEPGIQSVRNELSVATDTAASPTLDPFAQ